MILEKLLQIIFFIYFDLSIDTLLCYWCRWIRFNYVNSTRIFQIILNPREITANNIPCKSVINIFGDFNKQPHMFILVKLLYHQKLLQILLSCRKTINLGPNLQKCYTSTSRKLKNCYTLPYKKCYRSTSFLEMLHVIVVEIQHI